MIFEIKLATSTIRTNQISAVIVVSQIIHKRNNSMHPPSVSSLFGLVPRYDGSMAKLPANLCSVLNPLVGVNPQANNNVVVVAFTSHVPNFGRIIWVFHSEHAMLFFVVLALCVSGEAVWA